MRIEAHIICWNESEILPFVIKHYKKFCDHITVHDNYSTDSSQLIAESMGCDVKRFGIKGQLDDLHYLSVKNHCWKGSEADYVIVCDCDEVLLLTKEDADFFKNDNCTIIGTYGWQIYSNEMPNESILDITTGWHFKNYSKPVMFSPKHIKEINYAPGAHVCNPTGVIKWSDNTLYLLHYRNIGGIDRLIHRYKEYQKRMSFNNRKMGHGIHYWNSEKKLRQEWFEGIGKSKSLLV